MTREKSPLATTTLVELAADLAVSQKTVRRMIATGRIPKPMKLNGAYRWLIADIREWMLYGMPNRQELTRLKNQPENAGA